MGKTINLSQVKQRKFVSQAPQTLNPNTIDILVDGHKQAGIKELTRLAGGDCSLMSSDQAQQLLQTIQDQASRIGYCTTRTVLEQIKVPSAYVEQYRQAAQQYQGCDGCGC